MAAYGTVSIIIKKPFISATASQSTVAKGDRIYITGTAEGDPSSVQIWILGKNKYIKATESVNSDASFKFEVRQEVTANLYSGQYFVVAQHPMQNNRFDIDTVDVVGASLNQIDTDQRPLGLQQAAQGQRMVQTTPGSSSSAAPAACRDPTQLKHLSRESTTLTSTIPTPSSSSSSRNPSSVSTRLATSTLVTSSPSPLRPTSR